MSVGAMPPANLRPPPSRGGHAWLAPTKPEDSRIAALTMPSAMRDRLRP